MSLLERLVPSGLDLVTGAGAGAGAGADDFALARKSATIPSDLVLGAGAGDDVRSALDLATGAGAGADDFAFARKSATVPSDLALFTVALGGGATAGAGAGAGVGAGALERNDWACPPARPPDLVFGETAGFGVGEGEDRGEGADLADETAADGVEWVWVEWVWVAWVWVAWVVPPSFAMAGEMIGGISKISP